MCISNVSQRTGCLWVREVGAGWSTGDADAMHKVTEKVPSLQLAPTSRPSGDIPVPFAHITLKTLLHTPPEGAERTGDRAPLSCYMTVT